MDLWRLHWTPVHTVVHFHLAFQKGFAVGNGQPVARQCVGALPALQPGPVCCLIQNPSPPPISLFDLPFSSLQPNASYQTKTVSPEASIKMR